MSNDVINKVFKFSEKEIKVVGTSDNPWFCGKDVAELLEYKNTNDALLKHIFSKNKKNLRDLLDILDEYNYKQEITYNEGNTIYVNKNGLVELLVKSRKPNKTEFVKFCETNFNIACKAVSFLRKEQDCIGSLIKTFAHKKFKTQYKVGSYRIDLYFEKEKLAIECDEFDHKDRDQNYEKERQSYIKEKLGCKFIRFNPDSETFCIFKLINKIMKEL